MLEVLILPKFDELCLSVDTLKPHLVCIVETWLSKEISNNAIISVRQRPPWWWSTHLFQIFFLFLYFHPLPH